MLNRVLALAALIFSIAILIIVVFTALAVGGSSSKEKVHYGKTYTVTTNKK